MTIGRDVRGSSGCQGCGLIMTASETLLPLPVIRERAAEGLTLARRECALSPTLSESYRAREQERGPWPSSPCIDSIALHIAQDRLDGIVRIDRAHDAAFDYVR